jgi:hypothetical protein
MRAANRLAQRILIDRPHRHFDVICVTQTPASHAIASIWG